jgi:hypothetical protein
MLGFFLLGSNRVRLKLGQNGFEFYFFIFLFLKWLWVVWQECTLSAASLLLLLFSHLFTDLLASGRLIRAASVEQCPCSERAMSLAPPDITWGLLAPLPASHAHLMCNSQSTFKTFRYNTCNIQKKTDKTLETCVWNTYKNIWKPLQTYTTSRKQHLDKHTCNVRLKNIWNIRNIHLHVQSLQHMQHRDYFYNIRMKHLKHISETTKTLKTNACNMPENAWNTWNATSTTATAYLYGELRWSKLPLPANGVRWMGAQAQASLPLLPRRARWMVA